MVNAEVLVLRANHEELLGISTGVVSGPYATQASIHLHGAVWLIGWDD